MGGKGAEMLDGGSLSRFEVEDNKGIRAVSDKHPSVPRRNINKQLAGIYVRVRLRVDVGRYLSARRRRRANKAD